MPGVFDTHEKKKKKTNMILFFNLLLWDNRTLGYHPFGAKGKGNNSDTVNN